VTDVAAPLGIGGVAVALLLVAGQFDLSIGVVAVASSLVTALLVSQAGLGIWPAPALSPLAALLVGAVNGLLVVATGLPSFLVALATFLVLQGGSLAVSAAVAGSSRVSGLAGSAGWMGAERELGVRVSRTTVWQDLAVAPLMSVWRNFFLDAEPTRGVWPFRQLDVARAQEVCAQAMARAGVPGLDPDQPASALQAGERQSLTIARALHFGARVLVIDEPTAPMTVAQRSLVLQSVVAARDQGLALTRLIAGGDELQRLTASLQEGRPGS
jgi:ABC-type polar amino acid transport system ATPase subunit